ncbi:MAG: hypothetical protein ACRDI2_15275 [Chloroflexota bacterium]
MTTTATQQKAVEQVEVGDVVLQYGYRYQVRQNIYDPYGNTGSSPRHVLVADALMSDAQAAKEGWIYTRGMTLGHRVGAQVTVEVR